MASVPTLFLDRAVVFANFILIEGWSARETDTIEFFIAASNEAAPIAIACNGIARFARPDVSRIARASKREGEYFGFVARFPLEAAASLSPLASGLSWIARSADDLAQITGAARTIGTLGGGLDAAACDTVQRAIAHGLVSPPVAALFEALRGDAAALRPLVMHADAGGRAGRVVGLDLWVENAQARSLVALSEDGTSAAEWRDMVFTPRPDVSQHLGNLGARIVTDFHGAFVLLRQVAGAIQRVWVGAFDNGRVETAGSVPTPTTLSAETLVGRATTLLGGGGLPDPQTADHWLRPMVERARPPVGFRQQSFRAAAAKPEVSIVVPMYGESYFIRSLVTMQLLLGERAEWIIVCDDPRIETQLSRFLKSRSLFLRANTRFVSNDENYGYSTANRIGAQHASSDAILFMNSDIWLDSAEALDIGLEAIRGGSYGVLGFQLLYEDGAVQHDGMAFERRASLSGLYAIAHPGKGLPPRRAVRPLAPAVAVTGALMLASRRVLDAVDGFTPDYILGDFEDADLCLKVAESGHAVGIVRAPGCYHLERQSIRKLGDAGYRQAITYLNCIRFNRRWDSTLREMEARSGGAAARRAI